VPTQKTFHFVDAPAHRDAATRALELPVHLALRETTGCAFDVRPLFNVAAGAFSSTP
jgi:hypothetical protein